MAEGMIGGMKMSDLPASSYAYCEPGDGAPSTRCHFPIRGKDGKPDAAHVRNALARLGQSPFGEKARAKVEAAARELGIGEPAQKATGELKAEPLDTSKLDRWLTGKMPRRILVLPYGGTIPSEKAPRGVDIDGEWFSERTDLFDGRPALMATRQRVVDWHHDNDPTGLMKGAMLGHIVMDETAEDDGLWADFWVNAGERRKEMFRVLETRGASLYGSSQAARKAKDLDTGEITVWPLVRHTITTSPQNRLAVVPPLKAILTAPSLDEIPAEALKALLVGLDASTAELLMGSADAAVTASAQPGSDGVKAGRVLSRQTQAELEKLLEEAERTIPDLIRRLLARARPEENQDA
jgi:hypothetical protein